MSDPGRVIPGEVIDRALDALRFALWRNDPRCVSCRLLIDKPDEAAVSQADNVIAHKVDCFVRYLEKKYSCSGLGRVGPTATARIVTDPSQEILL